MTVTSLSEADCAKNSKRFYWRRQIKKMAAKVALKFETTQNTYYHLYENETESDITLFVGEKGFQERMPGHSWVLALGTECFRAMFQGLLSQSTKVYEFPHDDPKAFSNLIRWLYQNKCDLPSLQSSLLTLKVAIKYLCPELAEYCIAKMDDQIDESNVLEVLEGISCYCHHSDLQIPSAPPLEEIQENKTPSPNRLQTADSAVREYQCTQDPTASCHHLLNKCLELIDKKTDQVINSEYFESINPQVLKVIFKRNSLNLSSELVALEALYRWSNAVCKREHLPLTPESRRQVLGPLLYQVRIFTVSPSEFSKFLSSRHLLSLYDDKEVSYMTAFIKKDRPLPLKMPQSICTHEKAMTTRRQSSSQDSLNLIANKNKKKFKKKFNKKEIILDLISFLSFIFD